MRLNRDQVDTDDKKIWNNFWLPSKLGALKQIYEA